MYSYTKQSLHLSSMLTLKWPPNFLMLAASHATSKIQCAIHSTKDSYIRLAHLPL